MRRVDIEVTGFFKHKVSYKVIQVSYYGLDVLEGLYSSREKAESELKRLNEEDEIKGYLKTIQNCLNKDELKRLSEKVFKKARSKSSNFIASTAGSYITWTRSGGLGRPGYLVPNTMPKKEKKSK